MSRADFTHDPHGEPDLNSLQIVEPCPSCGITKPIGIPCICYVLAKHGHAIHTHTILNEAWKRVSAVPIVKSMHPETRAAIMDALFGTAPQEPAK